MRGLLDSIAQSPVYTDAEKDWYITLQQSTCYWYELIVNPPDFLDTKSGISAELDLLRSEVEQTLEKRFIYFFASRRKVRFDVSRPPRYERFSGKLVLHLLVGKRKRRVVLKRRLLGPDGSPIRPRVELSERFIRIFLKEDASQTWSIHDFLQYVDFGLGEPTTVHYVGITKDPGDRPLSRKHRGIADTLYNVSNEENDFFVYINLFKVVAHAGNAGQDFVFVAANAMTGEIQTEEEGAIVEGALIAYFECDSQQLNRTRERSSFRGRLDRIALGNRIRSVAVHLEAEPWSEYFCFGSAVVPASPNHTFVFESTAGDLRLTKLSSEEDLLARVQAKNGA